MENGASAKKVVRRLHGKPNTKPNGKPIVKPKGKSVERISPPAAMEKARSKCPARRTSWLTSTVARLLTWFAIITIAFRCPADLESCDVSSPVLCAPYFRAKAAVTPHITPYYETYAEPYVDLARPYYTTAKNQVLLPAYNYASLYAAPRIEQAREFGQYQWEKNIQPQLDLYQQHAHVWYDGTVAPHVEQARHAMNPYIEISKDSALRTYHEAILPAYDVVQPYALSGYSACADYATNTVVPAANWTWTNAYVFFDGTVWPHIRFLYTENVEPQLIRIGERLGRHKNAGVSGSGSTDDSVLQNASSAASSASSAISSSVVQLSSTLAAMNTDSSKPSTPGSKEQQATPTPSASGAEGDDDDFVNDPRPVSEIVAHDLHKWESRYSKAAEDGVTAIVKRVDEISERMVDKGVKLTGQRLLEKLKDSVASEVDELKQRILVVAGSGTSPEEGNEAVAAAVRQVGLSVKEKAQDVRSWRLRFTEELQVQVTRAAENNVQILDEIRDLALQKIGMKWAWMDGVTYKDWQNFHELRSRLTEWTQSVKSVVVTHPGIEEAENAAQDIEDAAMEVAQAAANELTSIKKVGQWKVAAGDTTDDFDPAQMAVAESLGSQEDGETPVSEAAGEHPETEESVSDEESATINDAPLEDSSTTTTTDTESESSNGEALVDDKTSAVDDETLAVDDPLIQEAQEADAQTPAEHDAAVDDKVSGVQDPLIQEAEEVEAQTPAEQDIAVEHDIAVEDPLIQGAEEAEAQTPAEHDVARDEPVEPIYESNNVVQPASEPDNGQPLDQNESASDDLASEGSEAIMGATQAIVENLSTPKIKPAFLGAAAHSVASNDPILDVEADYLASITQMAQAAYSTAAAEASSRYSMASSVVSAQMYGTPQPVHKSLLSDLSASYSAAVAAASSQLNNVVDAASQGIRGTPTTTAKAILPTAEWSKAEAIAAEKLKEGRVWAEMQYSSVKVALGIATPTPTGQVDKVMAQAKYNYYAGLGVAHERYFDFLSAASSAFNSLTGGPTPTPTNLAGTASSVALAASASVASVAGSLAAAADEGASAAISAANSIAAAAGDSIESAIAEVEGEATEAVKALVGSWDAAVSQISAQIYGEPTPLLWYEDIVSGTLPSATEKVAEKVASVASDASDAVKHATEKDEL